MPRKNANVSLTSYDDIFGPEETYERVQEIPLAELHPFKNHPFQVRDDDEMRAMVESVKDKGITNAAVVRPREGGEVSEIACDGLFVAIGLIPENGAFENVAQLDKFGYLASGEDCLTVTPGVFAAGDCRSKGLRQLTTAAADGAVAAVAACRYIDAL